VPLCVGLGGNADCILGPVSRNVASRSGEAILPLCSTSESLKLGCCVQFRASQYKEDMDILEGVQCRATKVVRGLEHLIHEEKLLELDLLGLRRRGLRGDLTCFYNCLMED